MNTIVRVTGGGVLTDRTARWEDEAGLEGEVEGFRSRTQPDRESDRGR